MSSDCEKEAELPDQADPNSEDRDSSLLTNSDLTDLTDPTPTDTDDLHPTDTAGNTTFTQDCQTDPAERRR